jgi:DnaJ-class molecular chaperone
MKKYLIILLFGFQGLWSQVQFEARVSKNALALNERLRIDFTMNIDGDNFIQPNFEGFKIIGHVPQQVIQEKPNSDIGWVRDGNNLVYTYKLSLSDALTDCSLQIPTLDKRILSIACPEVVSPYYEKVVVGEGMPVSKKGDGSKGDLIIKFYIQFPKYLNGTKRNKLREILANEDYTTV